jgi:hypothetical protein
LLVLGRDIAGKLWSNKTAHCPTERGIGTERVFGQRRDQARRTRTSFAEIRPDWFADCGAYRRDHNGPSERHDVPLLRTSIGGRPLPASPPLS